MNPFKQIHCLLHLKTNQNKKKKKMKRPNELNKEEKSECTNYGLYVGVDLLN